MTATAAEALELALWLHRAPIRRATLLARPLPDGIGQLLRVAGGAPDQVAAAAMITGEDEATILEAVRFYLQQILFNDEADAYRVLGLRPDAPPEQAREHHRLLQQWLHPDRRGSDDWDSVYATRINRAWSQLRTPQSRAAYDATLADTAAPPGGSRQGGEYQVASRSTATVPLQPPRNRSRNLTLAVLLGCIGLLVLIALRQERPPQWQDFRPALADAATVPSPGPEQADIAPLMSTLGAALVDAVEPVPEAPPVPDPRPAIPAASTRVAAAVVAAPVETRRSPAPPARPSARRPTAARPEPVPVSVAVQPAPQASAEAPPVDTLALAVPAPVDTPAPVMASVSIPDALARMTQARDRAHQVTVYLADPTAAAPPVWNDVPTLRKAQRLRVELHRRLGMPQQVELEWRDPKWRLTAEGAWLETGYRAAAEQGRLGIAFGWREDQLLVRSIDMVPGT